jgi:hypothetical protein
MKIKHKKMKKAWWGFAFFCFSILRIAFGWR